MDKSRVYTSLDSLARYTMTRFLDSSYVASATISGSGALCVLWTEYTHAAHGGTFPFIIFGMASCFASNSASVHPYFCASAIARASEITCAFACILGFNFDNPPFAILAQVASGQICDGKTIMLLQYAKLHGLVD